jgi:hypothetical protein
MTAAPDTDRERFAEYRRLFAQALVGRERTAEGIRFRLRDEPGIEAWVRDLAAREKACCGFFAFAVARRDGEVVLDAAVIDDDVARAILEEFYRLPDTAADSLEASGTPFVWQGVQLSSDAAGTVHHVPSAGDAG